MSTASAAQPLIAMVDAGWDRTLIVIRDGSLGTMSVQVAVCCRPLWTAHRGDCHQQEFPSLLHVPPSAFYMKAQQEPKRTILVSPARPDQHKSPPNAHPLGGQRCPPHCRSRTFIVPVIVPGSVTVPSPFARDDRRIVLPYRRKHQTPSSARVQSRLGAGVHGSNQHEVGREGQRACGVADGHDPGFRWLPHYF